MPSADPAIQLCLKTTKLYLGLRQAMDEAKRIMRSQNFVVAYRSSPIS